MSTYTLKKEFNSFVKNCMSDKQDSIQIEKEIASIIAKNELDRNLEKGMSDYENGRYEIVNEESNKKLLEEIAKNILP